MYYISEVVAVVTFGKQFRHYLYGRPFLFRTDHSLLIWLKHCPLDISTENIRLQKLNTEKEVFVAMQMAYLGNQGKAAKEKNAPNAHQANAQSML